MSNETPLPQPEPIRDDVGPLVGRTFGGYEIVSYIGEGPAGAVYRGEDLLGNAMAVKVLHADLANRERTEQLRRELELLSGLDHAQLQKIYDCGYGDEGQFFYVTDELVGCDLETGLDDSGGLAPRKSYEIIRAVCQGLDVAHRAGVVHGGLRPRNVFLMPLDISNGSGSGRTAAVKVLDFGAARLGGGSDRGILAGLPAYLAPEQLDGECGPKSDLFALGVLMYELFSGAMPVFRGAHMLAGRVSGAQRGIVAPPANVDPPLARLIVSLLSTDPARRPDSAAHVLAELEIWAQSAGGLLDPLQPAVVRRRGPSIASGSIGPDSTMRMSKFDAIALAQETLPSAMSTSTQDDDHEGGLSMVDEKETFMSDMSDDDAEDGIEASEVGGDSEATAISAYPENPAHAKEPAAKEQGTKAHATEGRKTMTQTPRSSSTTGTPKDANASESVEASLEDFISQANASFPAAADGWDLHTGDVELIDDQATGEPVAKPRVVEVPTAPAPKRHTAQIMTSAPAVESAPVRVIEQTEVVSTPLRSNTSGMQTVAAPASWTQNPLIVGAIVLGAVIIGMGAMFIFIKTLVPQQQQPIIVQAPAAPAAAAPAAVAPTAAAPVVTPLPPTVVGTPVVVTPLTPPVAAAVTPTAPPAVKSTAPVVHKASKKTSAEKAEKAEKSDKSEKAVSAKKDKETAPAAKKDAPAKKDGKKSGGSDWVDPFAN